MNIKNVVIVMFTTDGELVVVSRRNQFGLLGLPGGKIDDGETPTEAIVRETKEELDIDVSAGELSRIFCSNEGNDLTAAYILNRRVDIDSRINDENCMITTVKDIGVICNPNTSPFWEYNRELSNVINTIPS